MKWIKKLKRPIHNNKGQALLEAVPLIVIFVIFFAYSLGLFGVIHSGILFSISARNYAFETFRNRTNVDVFRYSANSNSGNLVHFREVGFRYHLVYDRRVGSDDDLRATAKPIVVGLNREPQGDDPQTHNVNLYEDVITGERNQAVSVHPAWLMIGYGICIDAQCGAN
jgi:hypothetical protein